MEKKPPLERMQWFIAELKSGHHPNAPQLADAFEMSLPTAYRDIEFLRDRLGAPIRYDGSLRGYTLDNQSFELPSVWISDHELLLLALARELFLDPDAQSTLDDLMQKISHCSNTDLDRIRRSITYKGTGHYPIKEGILSRIIEAILKGKRIEVLYSHVFTPDREPTWTSISPLHLLFYRGNWYLMASIERSIRTYALSRMEEVRLLSEEIPGDFSMDEIRKMIEGSFGIFVTDTGQSVERVRLRFSAGIAGYVRRTFFHPDQEMEDLAEGGLILTFPSTINREVIGEILSFGNEVMVLAPPALRSEIRRILQETQKNFEKG